MYLKEIAYDRTTKDYKAILDGRPIGFYANHHAAETALDRTVFELLSDGHFASATELDGGAACPTCGDDGDCPDCDKAPESLREDCLNVITMALGSTHGAASVVAELRRVKARLEEARGANMARIEQVQDCAVTQD